MRPIKGLYPGTNCICVNLDNQILVALTDLNEGRLEDFNQIEVGRTAAIFTVKELVGPYIAVVLEDCSVLVFDYTTGALSHKVTHFNRPDIERKDTFAVRLIDDQLFILARAQVRSKGMHIEYILARVGAINFEPVGCVSIDSLQPISASIDSCKSFCLITQEPLSQFVSPTEQHSFQVNRFQLLSAQESILHALKNPLPVETTQQIKVADDLIKLGLFRKLAEIVILKSASQADPW